ncbi:hypothetical protein CRENBAI_000105 [Crenichthys baileyi]|uniref:Uncharacterized protein n=1 Tax=Crenichthys baileyi TaxID=28760 RepID=A0AAV9R2W2_9TELE
MGEPVMYWETDFGEDGRQFRADKERPGWERCSCAKRCQSGNFNWDFHMEEDFAPFFPSLLFHPARASAPWL